MTARSPGIEKGRQPEEEKFSLLTDLRSGDENALDAMVREHQGVLYRFLLRLSGDPDEALDLVQETFVRALRGVASFRGESTIRTWLHRIAVNLFLNERRGPRKQFVDLDSLESLTPSWWERWRDRVPDPEEIVANREQLGRLEEAIARLPEEYRAVLLLRDREGYRSQEVSALLGISVAAVKSRLLRARLFVRNELLKAT